MEDAVLQVYERSRRQLCAVAARYVGDEAEDVVQDAFLSALRAGYGFRGDAAPLTWISRIVVNASIDRCRRRVRRERAHGTRHTHHRPPAKTTADDTMAIRAALRGLTRNQRRVFVLYDVLGHTHTEIARQLAIPLGTSKRRLGDARKKLRQAL